MYALHDGFVVAEPAAATPFVRPPMMSEAAVPDLPSEIGLMILGSYGAIMAAFLALFMRSADAAMMVVISTGYVVMYLTVPSLFLKTESRSGRLSMAKFMADGIETWTGHVGGRAALVQILSIPLTIACAVTAIGIVFRFAI
ncbi:hypothetical protein [Novosphingobium sp.]|uniref:hypothetical protein n=1 Tax=Novosphingobium sp. TaxID=1874826 RepID=UPI003BAC68C8